MNRTLAIIPAALRETVNAAIYANTAFENKREHEFSVALYAANDEAQENPTHYWLSHPFTHEQRTAVAQLQAAFPSSMVFDYDDPQFPDSKLQELGLVRKTNLEV